MHKSSGILSVLLTVACILPGHATAEAADSPHVAIELNAVDAVEGSCRLSFLIQNGHDADITQAVYEAVLFDTDGRVALLTLFDFGTLPAGRPRVRQFVVPGQDCAELGRLLINGAETCAGAGVPVGACTTGLRLRSRTNLEVLG